MKVFVSWSGQQSRATAESLRSWLILFFPSLSIWVSSADLVAGDRWHEVLTRELGNTDFGIICLDRQNLSSPWLLFEAGALSKSLDQGRVIPFLSDLEFNDIPDPLRYFQAIKNDRNGLREIVQSLSIVHPDNRRSDHELDVVFEALASSFGSQSGSSSIRHSHTKPEVEFYKANGLIILIDRQKLTLTESEYCLYLFLCMRSADGLPSFPYYKAAPYPFLSWLSTHQEPSQVQGGRRWSYVIEHHGGWQEMRRTVSSIKRKISGLSLEGDEGDLLPQRGRIGVNVSLRQDVVVSETQGSLGEEP